MAGIWAAFLAFLVPILTPLIGRIMVALGLSVVAYTGISTLTTLILNKIATAAGGVAADLTNIIGISGADQGVTIILSAYSAAMTIKFAQGSIKRITGVSAS